MKESKKAMVRRKKEGGTEERREEGRKGKKKRSEKMKQVEGKQKTTPDSYMTSRKASFP